jgi:NADPH-dependent 2,4-dienoyl-CoA reductase/sulfur reductase-like enzyme
MTVERHDLVVVGGSDAGISAGMRAHEVDPGVEPLVLVADAYPNFSICGLPFYLSGETPDWRDLAHRDRADLEAAGLQLRLEHTAVDVDAERHVLTVDDPGGRQRTVAYGQLIIGTGAMPVRPPIEGLDLPGVHTLHTMDHVFAVHDDITSAVSGCVVVVGAGYIGLELADAFVHRGLDVTVVEMLDQVLATVDAELADDLRSELELHGVTVATGVTVTAIEQAGAALRVCTNDGAARPADVVVVATGVRPNTALGEAAGVTIGETGAIAVDERMRTGVPDVFAAGDCVETRHALLDRPTYLPLGTTAHKQGRVAGANAAGRPAVFAGSLGSQVVKLFDRVVARTGLRPQEAHALGFDPRTVDVTVDDHKAYYPGATDLRMRLTADAGGRLLGAQLLGHSDAEVAKRCDVVATAIQLGCAVDDLLDLDLTYTPPLSAPWDPVQQVAQRWSTAATTA